MDALGHARAVLDAELAALRQLRNQLDDSFATAVDWLVRCANARNKVVIAGVGKSGIVGRKVAATLTSTGTTAVVLDPVDALHGDLGILNDGDVAIILSYSGESEELLGLLPAMRRFRVQIIAMTADPRSTLGQASDLVLGVRVPREACPFNLAPTASTTACMALGDALAVAVLKARGFKKKDFALRHPSGAIGRALLLRVGDIMREQGRNPVASRTMKVREALLVMTRARSGSVSVVGPTGKLVGVFTDGDLRRRMAEGDDVLDLPLSKVMTPKPVCLRMDALAVEAIQIFQEKAVDDLIIVDRDRRPVGVIDSQDLPRLKLA